MNMIYDLARERFLTGQNYLTTVWDTWLVTAEYVFNPAHTNFLTDVPVGARVRRAMEQLPTKTATAGYANSGAITFGSFASNLEVAAFIFISRTTNMMLWYADTGFNLPFKPDGTEVILRPDFARGGWFRI